MIEDITDYNGSNGIYKQQAPLRPPPLPPASVHTSVSPRFDNPMTQSNPAPWSPTHFDRNPYDKPSNVDPLGANHTITRSTDIWTNNNNPNNYHNNTPNNYNNNNPNNYNNNINPYAKPSDVWMSNNNTTTNNNSNINNTHTRSDVWTNHQTQSKTSELWGPNNAITKTTDSTLISNNSSNVPMIQSSKKQPWYSPKACSPRCKLGILGFIIGFLTVSIALAVVLVLWLRQS